MNDTFKRDLKEGKIIEHKHLKLIQKIYPDAYIVDGYCKEWDIYIPSESMGIEVKSDKMSIKTGNIVIETEFNGKPSAMSTSKSMWWIFDTGVEVIKVKLSDLKELVKSFNLVQFIGNGDSKMKKAYLIPIQSIRNIGSDW